MQVYVLRSADRVSLTWRRSELNLEGARFTRLLFGARADCL